MASGKAQATAKNGVKDQKLATATPVNPHLDESLATKLARDAYARDKYQFMLRVITVLLVFLGLSLVVNIYYGTRPTEFRYFAVDPEGHIHPVDPLDRPFQSTIEILNWASLSVTKSFTLSFANYQSQIDENRLFFTDLGWSSFEKALKTTKLLDTIINQKYVTSAVVTAAPVITGQGIADENRYAWQIEMPILVTFESASGKTSQPYTVKIIVVRRPEVENPQGLGIAQIIAH